MDVVLILLVSGLFLLLAGRLYARFLARNVGEDAARPTPALARPDGRDYVATPTAVVFAHHFASIAGAGPILGPVLAIIYGWVPALLWVLVGGVFIGAVHDYLATYMATREGGESIASIARRALGADAFAAVTILLVIMLALVCAAFLNASAAALTSTLPFERLDLSADQTLLRVVDQDGDRRAVIGGIASMSVVCITVMAPLVGYLYVVRKVPVWLCSLLAVAICAVSIAVGLVRPIALDPTVWKLLLSGYVLLAAGVPVWIFLQSRDFINVHILYVGMAALVVMLGVAAVRGGMADDPLPALAPSAGSAVHGPIWPMLFILIACGAVSGFHSLCASGTTCKQLRSEPAARRVGYNGMLLESFLAVCVICVLLVGTGSAMYRRDVYPALVGVEASGNPILGFAMAVGGAGRRALGLPAAVGAIGGMVLLEGFLVTTLDTAIRLTRYLIEEIWRTLFGRYDVFAEPVAAAERRDWGRGDDTPVGAEGIPIAPGPSAEDSPPAGPVSTRGVGRVLLRLLRLYWVNSGLAVGLMLAFAFSGGVKMLWGIFAASNQLLAAIVLVLASIWLLRRGRRAWFALLPAGFMVATTSAALVLLLAKYLRAERPPLPLVVANVVLMAITLYLLFAAGRALLVLRRRPIAQSAR
jgi:carbon starvation protein